jgi:hypothetical protein
VGGRLAIEYSADLRHSRDMSRYSPLHTRAETWRMAGRHPAPTVS